MEEVLPNMPIHDLERVCLQSETLKSPYLVIYKITVLPTQSNVCLQIVRLFDQALVGI